MSAIERTVTLFALAVPIALGCCGTSEGGEAPAENGTPSGRTAGSVSQDGVSLEWEFSEDFVEFILTAPTTGWVAVGFDATSAMLEADIAIGYVSENQVFMSDQWGDGYTSHSADRDLGGSSDLEVLEGSETGGVTRIVFRRPLDTEDEFDHVLVPDGEHSILLAYGPDGNDSYQGRHEWVETFRRKLD